MIDIDKQYQTRDGRKVRLISNNGSEMFPIIGVIERCNAADCWRPDGKFGGPGSLDHHNDLVPVPPPVHTMYLNVYATSGAFAYETRADADRVTGATRMARVKVTYRKGQFDE